MEKPMSFQEKKALTMMIKNLHTGHLKGVWQIVCNDNPSLSMKKELVIDIERLPTRTARELEKYVKTKVLSANKASKKKQKKSQLGFSGDVNENTVPENPMGSVFTGNPESTNNMIEEPTGGQGYNQGYAGEENKAVGVNMGYNQAGGEGQGTGEKNDREEEASSDSSFFTDLDSDEENK